MRTRTTTPPPLESLLADVAREIELSIAAPANAVRSLPTVADQAALAAYLLEAFGARIPAVRVCEGHVSPWEVFCAAYFATSPVIVLKASRGFGGKTWLAALLALAKATLLGIDVTVLGGSGAQSRRVHAAMAKFWAYHGSPRHLLVDQPGVTMTKFTAGNTIEALTASQRSARGAHPTQLVIDEADELDLRIFDAAMGQTLAIDGVPAQTIIASTHQHPDGTFTEILRRAPDQGWAVMTYCYRETLQPHGWLDPAEVGRKRAEVTQAMWNAEFEGQEPSATGRAIDQEAVERMFDPACGEGEGALGTDEVYEWPQAGASYATGADWAKEVDYTAIATVRHDVRPARFVSFYRDRKQPFHVIVSRVFDPRLKRYPGAGCHDASGIGSVIDELKTHDVEAYTGWQGKSRIVLFSSLIAAIEADKIRAPRSTPWYHACKYVTNNDLYGSGHPPDEFVAMALAWRAATHAPKVCRSAPTIVGEGRSYWQGPQ